MSFFNDYVLTVFSRYKVLRTNREQKASFASLVATELLWK